METKTFIGIDISSATLDICVNTKGQKESVVINNDVKGVSKFFRKYNRAEVIVAMENTGRYNWALYEVLSQMICRVFVISPLHLKKSMGLVRGKNDKIDAIRIGSFIEKHYHELPVWKSPTASIQKLKLLLTERTYRIKIRKQLAAQQNDYPKMKKLGLDRKLSRMSNTHEAMVDEQIKIIEKEMNAIIEADTELKKQSDLMKSVPGVGKVMCWMMLAKTNGFTLITTPRQMACYCGVVPFDYQSGSSIRGKHRLSFFADKSMKSILHLAAMSAIRLKNDLRTYYQRKVAEGKNKMSVLNAVRNKIIHRIFAVIKNQQPYCLDMS